MTHAKKHYDAIVIGAGQAGGPLSTTLARAGWKTAIIEREYVGGSCVNYGCTPTKTMVASARVAYLSRRAADFGVRTGEIRIDMEKIRQRKRNIVESFRHGSQKGIETTDGVDLIMGEASFVDANTIEINRPPGDTETLTAEKYFINTGTRPAIPPIPGIEEIDYFTNKTIMELGVVPDHLLVIGGGYIGLEFGQMFRRFGSDVTIIQRGNQLLTREDPDVAEEVTKILREDGVEILLMSQTLSVKRKQGSSIQLQVQTPEGKKSISGSHLLVAAGRRPNTDRLNLPAAGIEVSDRGFIPANEYLQTAVPHIYALGDVKGGPAFTHISYDDFRIIRTNLIEGGNASINGRLVPYTVFIDPELGRVGISETEAQQKGLNIRVARLPMAHVARALESDETRGFMKAIVDSETHQILGAAILGIYGGEIMSVLQMAMMGRVPYTAIKDGVFAHPTLSESLNNLFMAMDRK